MATETENHERLLSEYEYYKGQIESLQENINMIDASIMQIEATIEALKGLSDLKDDNEILLPIGSDSFVKARILDREAAIVGIGADVAVKKSIADSIQELVDRRKDMDKLRKERAEILEKALASAQAMAPRLQELMAKSGQEG